MLVALAMVVLIAFVGLALDGGLAYSERREAQNATDAAAMAGSVVNRLFGGRVAPLVAHFAESQALSTQDIDELTKLIKDLSNE